MRRLTTVARAEKAAVTVVDGARAAFETNARAAVSALAIAACATAMPEAAHASGSLGSSRDARRRWCIRSVSARCTGFRWGRDGSRLQWRRVRTVGDEITELKKTLPADAGRRREARWRNRLMSSRRPRKELVAGKFKDKHANMGYLLLALGVTLAVEGGMNTYLRVGKLFPGPHLYAGASIVVLWAMASWFGATNGKGQPKSRATCTSR